MAQAGVHVDAGGKSGKGAQDMQVPPPSESTQVLRHAVSKGKLIASYPWLRANSWPIGTTLSDRTRDSLLDVYCELRLLPKVSEMDRRFLYGRIVNSLPESIIGKLVGDIPVYPSVEGPALLPGSLLLFCIGCGSFTLEHLFLYQFSFPPK